MKNDKTSLEFTMEDWEVIRNLVSDSYNSKEFEWQDFQKKYTKEYRDKLFSEISTLANIHNKIEEATRSFRNEKRASENSSNKSNF